MGRPALDDSPYTRKSVKIKYLPAPVLRNWENHKLLLPENYPTGNLEKRETFTASMWNAYSKCQRNFALRYIAGFQKKGGYMPLHVGTVFHSMISGILLGGSYEDAGNYLKKWVSDMTSMWTDLNSQGLSTPWDLDKVNEQAELLKDMVLRWHPGQMDPMAVAIQGRVPLINENGRRHSKWDYGFEMDGIVQDGEFGDLWVWELKTTSMSTQAAFESYIEHDPQAWGYMWAASKIFGKPVGIVYDVTRKKIMNQEVRLTKCRKGKCLAKLKKDHPSIGKNPMFGFLITSQINQDCGGMGVNDCDKCGGSGFIGISTQTKTLNEDVVNAAATWLSGFQCEDWTNQIDSDEWEAFISKVRYEASNMRYRIWRRPTAEYLDAFEKGSYGVAREIHRKKRLSGNFAISDEWLPMRGSCSDFTGGGCSFTPICPSINGAGFSLFESRDTSKPVELVEGNDESHQRGIIPSFFD